MSRRFLHSAPEAWLWKALEYAHAQANEEGGSFDDADAVLSLYLDVDRGKLLSLDRYAAAWKWSKGRIFRAVPRLTEEVWNICSSDGAQPNRRSADRYLRLVVGRWKGAFEPPQTGERVGTVPGLSADRKPAFDSSGDGSVDRAATVVGLRANRIYPSDHPIIPAPAQKRPSSSSSARDALRSLGMDDGDVEMWTSRVDESRIVEIVHAASRPSVTSHIAYATRALQREARQPRPAAPLTDEHDPNPLQRLRSVPLDDPAGHRASPPVGASLP